MQLDREPGASGAELRGGSVPPVQADPTHDRDAASAHRAADTVPAAAEGARFDSITLAIE